MQRLRIRYAKRGRARFTEPVVPGPQPAEPVGGAHRDAKQMAAFLKRALSDALRQTFISVAKLALMTITIGKPRIS